MTETPPSMVPCRAPESGVVGRRCRRALPPLGNHGRRRVALTSLFLGWTSLLDAAGCGPVDNTCSCAPCEAAIVLEVRDAQTGDGVLGFVVEARRDEELVAVPVGCGSDEPDGLCRVGTDAGRYHLVIVAPGYAPREQVVRVASRSASDTCCMGCVAPVPVTVSLEPLNSAPVE